MLGERVPWWTDEMQSKEPALEVTAHAVRLLMLSAFWVTSHLTHRNDCEHINTSRLHSEKCRAYASDASADGDAWWCLAGRWRLSEDSYLVDPASSHMLVSKIKPCMSKYKHFILWNCEWLIKSVIVYLIVLYYMDTCGNSRANTCEKSRLLEGMYLLD